MCLDAAHSCPGKQYAATVRQLQAVRYRLRERGTLIVLSSSGSAEGLLAVHPSRRLPQCVSNDVLLSHMCGCRCQEGRA